MVVPFFSDHFALRDALTQASRNRLLPAPGPLSLMNDAFVTVPFSLTVILTTIVTSFVMLMAGFEQPRNVRPLRLPVLPIPEPPEPLVFPVVFSCPFGRLNRSFIDELIFDSACSVAAGGVVCTELSVVWLTC